MNVAVDVAARDEQPLVEAMAQYYIYDLSDALHIDLGPDGRFAPLLPVQRFFDDPLRHPFLIRVDGTLAGFAVVGEGSRLGNGAGVRDVAELFVVRRYRRRGVGARVATWLFDRFAGPWEVRQKAENRAATAFWRTVIGRYSGGAFEEQILDDERWRGPVQRFVSAARY